jgi:hypothetical protein
MFSWVGEKNTLLQALVSALPCAACKSVFFCAVAFMAYRLYELQFHSPDNCLSNLIATKVFE